MFRTKKKDESKTAITAQSKIVDVERQVPDFRDFVSAVAGRAIPDSAWAMAKRVSLEFLFARRMNWGQDKFNRVLEVLNEAARTGSIPENQRIEFTGGKKKSRIELAEERNFWGGHSVYFDRLPFADDNMSFIFQWHLSASYHGGSTAGEMYAAAMKVEDGNTESFKTEFFNLAERIRFRGEACLENDHIISAREAFLRAANYYRLPLWVVDAQKEEYREIALKMRSCFRKAAGLCSPEIEVVEVPFEGSSLPGYFIKADQDSSPKPTVIFLGGGETFAEDGYYVLGPSAVMRGFNMFTVEYPGEGLTPFEGLYHRQDEEVPLAAILDYLHSRADVDKERIATYGISMGGYVGPRAAAYDQRIKAVVANSMLYDIFPTIDAYHSLLATRELADYLPSIWTVLETCIWRWGGEATGNPHQLAELNRPFNVDPSLIQCPVLILVGEGEYRSADYIRNEQHHAMEVMPNPKNKLVIGRADEGAAHHCIPENPALVAEVVFGWLEEVLG